MAFNSYAYLVSLAVAVWVYWLIPAAWRRGYLLAMSVAYYATWKLEYAPLPFVVCGIAWWCGRRMETEPERAGTWLQRGIVLVLAFLSFFKYRQFLVDSWNGVAGWLWTSPTWAIALPLGISFYTFEAISYLIDKHQGRIKKATPTDLGLFVMFWPHLMAGPIVRFRELIPQLSAPRPFEMSMLTRGLDRLIWGLVQKNLLANSLAAMVDEGFLPVAAAANSSVDNWYLAVAFGLQIYFDFAGYSNMAIGAAQLLGVQLPENFRFPYHAAHPQDFWARWHMTLSRWIRDYLFFPINARYGGAPLPLYASLIGIMGLVGLWHGAGWGFVAWGVMHGVYLVLYRIGEGKPVPAVVWRLFTLAAVTAAWIPFRAPTLEQAAAMLKSMFFGFRFGISYNANYYLVALLIAVFCVAEPWLVKGLDRLEAYALARPWTSQLHQWGLRPLLYAAGLLAFMIFDDQDAQFIYFQF